LVLFEVVEGFEQVLLALAVRAQILERQERYLQRVVGRRWRCLGSGQTVFDQVYQDRFPTGNDPVPFPINNSLSLLGFVKAARGYILLRSAFWRQIQLVITRERRYGRWLGGS
jgi:hypothetical protein